MLKSRLKKVDVRSIFRRDIFSICKIKFSCCSISFIEPTWCTSSIIAWYRFRTVFSGNYSVGNWVSSGIFFEKYNSTVMWTFCYKFQNHFKILSIIKDSKVYFFGMVQWKSTLKIETYLAETKSWEIIMNHCFFFTVSWTVFSGNYSLLNCMSQNSK